MLIQYKQKDFVPAPEGIHPAVLVDVVDLGLQKVTYDGEEKTQHKIRLVFQIDKTMPSDDEFSEPRRFNVYRKVTASLHPSSRLRECLASWLGQELSSEVVEKGIDLEELIGRDAQVHIMHKEGTFNGRPNTRAYISAILPRAEGAPKFLSDGRYLRVKDRDEEKRAKSETAMNAYATGSHGSDDSGDEDVPF